MFKILKKLTSSQCYRHLVYDAWFSGREELNLATGELAYNDIQDFNTSSERGSG